MSNLKTLIDAGATSVAGSLLLDGVEVARLTDGDTVITDEGHEALKRLADAPESGAKPAAKKAAAKKASGKSAPEPEVESSPELDGGVDMGGSLDDLIDE